MSSDLGNQEGGDIKYEFEVSRREAGRLRSGRTQSHKEHACEGLRWKGVGLLETLKKASVARRGHSKR